MILGILGIIASVIVLYIVYIHYRKKNLSLGEFIIWAIIWIAAILANLFEAQLGNLLGQYSIRNMFQISVIIALFIVFVLIFFIYIKMKQNQRKTEKIVKELALKQKDI